MHMPFGKFVRQDFAQLSKGSHLSNGSKFESFYGRNIWVDHLFFYFQSFCLKLFIATYNKVWLTKVYLQQMIILHLFVLYLNF